MQCWQCGAKVRQGAKLCVYCGAILVDESAEEAGTPEDADVPRARDGRSRGNTPGPRGGLLAYAKSDDARDTPHADAASAWDDRAAAPEYQAPNYSHGESERAAHHVYDDASRQPPENRNSRDLNPRRAQPDPLNDPRAPHVLQQSRQPGQADARNYQQDGRSRERHADDRYDDRSGRGGYDGSRKDRRRADDRYDDRPARHRSVPEEAWSDEMSAYGRAYDSEERRGYTGEDYTAERYATGGYTAEGYTAEGYTAEGYTAEGEATGGYRGYTGEHGWDADYARRGGRDRYEGYDRRAGRPDDRRGRYDDVPPDTSWSLPALPVKGNPADARARGGTRAGAAGNRGKTSGRPSGASARRRKKSGSRGPIVLLLILLALGVVAGGVLLGPSLLAKVTHPPAGSTGQPPFATYTPGPAPTVVAHYKQFVNDHAQYAINYPEQWNAQNTNDTSQGQPDYVDTYTQTTPYGAVIVEQTPAFDAASNAAILDGEVKGGQQNGQSFTPTGAASTVSIGGEQWARQEYDVTRGSVKQHFAILACHHNGHGFALVLVATTDAFAQLSSGTFQTILKSFRFTN